MNTSDESEEKKAHIAHGQNTKDDRNKNSFVETILVFLPSYACSLLAMPNRVWMYLSVSVCICVCVCVLSHVCDLVSFCLPMLTMKIENSWTAERHICDRIVWPIQCECVVRSFCTFSNRKDLCHRTQERNNRKRFPFFRLVCFPFILFSSHLTWREKSIYIYDERQRKKKTTTQNQAIRICFALDPIDFVTLVETTSSASSLFFPIPFCSGFVVAGCCWRCLMRVLADDIWNERIVIALHQSHFISYVRRIHNRILYIFKVKEQTRTRVEERNDEKALNAEAEDVDDAEEEDYLFTKRCWCWNFVERHIHFRVYLFFA